MDSSRTEGNDKLEKTFLVSGLSCVSCQNYLIDKIKLKAPLSRPIFEFPHFLTFQSSSVDPDKLKRNLLPYKLFDPTKFEDFKSWERISLEKDWSILIALIFISTWISTISWSTYLTNDLNESWTTGASIFTVLSFVIFFCLSLKMLSGGVLSFIQTRKFNIDTLLFLESVAVILLGGYAISAQQSKYLFADTVTMSQSLLFFARTRARSKNLNNFDRIDFLSLPNSAFQFLGIRNRFHLLLKCNLALFSVVILFIVSQGHSIEQLVPIFILSPILICPCLYFSFSILSPRLTKLFFILALSYNCMILVTAANGRLNPQVLAVSMISFIAVLFSIMRISVKITSN